MHAPERNPFLDSACRHLRQSRPPSPTGTDFLSRSETVQGAPFISLWFRTRGCRHDAQGGCTMCNYGASTPVSEKQMVDSVRDGLTAIGRHDDMTLLLSPSGSMFDEWEVPRRARESIFRLARDVPMRTVLCETRAETVTEEGLGAFSAMFDDREAAIGIGLESADQWILTYCINKGLSLDTYSEAIRIARACTVSSTANVLLGAPFLTEAEAISDSVRSIRWALAQGTDSVVLFPAHVKRFTLSHWLWERDMYSPPSLWALAEVLQQLGPEPAQRVTISWYKDYFATGDSMPETGESSFVASPTTCPECRVSVLELLDEYRDGRDFETVRALASLECGCKTHWLTTLDAPAQASLAERVARAYERIGREILGTEWWALNGPAVIDEVLATSPRP